LLKTSIKYWKKIKKYESWLRNCKIVFKVELIEIGVKYQKIQNEQRNGFKKKHEWKKLIQII